MLIASLGAWGNKFAKISICWGLGQKREAIGNWSEAGACMECSPVRRRQNLSLYLSRGYAYAKTPVYMCRDGDNKLAAGAFRTREVLINPTAGFIIRNNAANTHSLAPAAAAGAITFWLHYKSGFERTPPALLRKKIFVFARHSREYLECVCESWLTAAAGRSGLLPNLGRHRLCISSHDGRDNGIKRVVRTWTCIQNIITRSECQFGGKISYSGSHNRKYSSLILFYELLIWFKRRDMLKFNFLIYLLLRE